MQQKIKFIGLELLFGLGILTMCLLSTSCKSLAEIGKTGVETITLTDENFTALNGLYANDFKTTIGRVVKTPYDDFKPTLLEQLFHNPPGSAWSDETGKSIDDKEKWIKIEFNSKRQATISMYHNDKLIFSKKAKGKFKKGYFYIRPKNYIIPIFPLLFGYNFERTRIGMTVDNDLKIDRRVNLWIFFIMAGGTSKGSLSSVYKRRD